MELEIEVIVVVILGFTVLISFIGSVVYFGTKTKPEKPCQCNTEPRKGATFCPKCGGKLPIQPMSKHGGY